MRSFRIHEERQHKHFHPTTLATHKYALLSSYTTRTGAFSHTDSCYGSRMYDDHNSTSSSSVTPSSPYKMKRQSRTKQRISVTKLASEMLIELAEMLASYIGDTSNNKHSKGFYQWGASVPFIQYTKSLSRCNTL